MCAMSKFAGMSLSLPRACVCQPSCDNNMFSFSGQAVASWTGLPSHLFGAHWQDRYLKDKLDHFTP